jgi:hypothetical protein
MAMKENFKEVLPFIEASLDDEFDFLAGCDPIWILNWMTSDKYILKPKQRIVVSPNTKEELIDWAQSDAASSNCLSLLRFASRKASDDEMLEYIKNTVRHIEYESNPEDLKDRLRTAKWILGDKLVIKELC